MNDHFDKIFKYICWTSAFVLFYVTAITFIPIPKENIRFADTAQGFLLGTMLAGGAAFLVGGSPMISNRRPQQPAGTTTADIQATIVTEPTPIKDEPKPEA